VYRLVIEDDEGHTTPVSLLRDELTIGRREGNSIRLTQRNVSRRHARVLRENNLFFVEDLGSYNGVRLNGERIAGRRALREGDIVQIGDYHLTIQRERAAAAAAKVPAGGASTIPTTHPGPVRAHVKTVPMHQTAPDAPSAEADTAAVARDAKTESGRGAEAAPSGAEGATTTPADSARATVPAADGLAAAIRFSVLTPALGVRELTLSSASTTIGSEADVVLPHRSLAKEHARVVVDGAGVHIHDLGGGVRVNGEAYASRTLREGDLVELAGVKLRLTARAAGSPTDVAPAAADAAVVTDETAPKKAPSTAPGDDLDAELAAMGQPSATVAEAALREGRRTFVPTAPDRLGELGDEAPTSRSRWIAAAIAAAIVALGVVLYFSFRSPAPESAPSVAPSPTATPSSAARPERDSSRRSARVDLGTLPAESPSARSPFPPRPLPLETPPREPVRGALGTDPREPASRRVAAPVPAAPPAIEEVRDERAERPRGVEREQEVRAAAASAEPTAPSSEPEPEDPPSPPPSRTSDPAPSKPPTPREPVAEAEPRKAEPAPPTPSSPADRARELIAEGTKVLLRSPPQAIGILRRALQLAPRLPDVHKQLGIAYNATGNDVAAVRHLKRYLSLRPGAPDAAEIRAMIGDAQPPP
jgi:pSer/pThr/pTyr-binding forkhead associated (FHA) protein